jgi:serine/threonine-protein kinase RsbW
MSVYDRPRTVADEVVQDVVELRLPPEAAYLSVLRTATAGLAARLDFTLDEIEDLRIAVDEACALVLPDVRDGIPLVCRFVLEPDCLQVSVEATTHAGQMPARESFAWTVLTALAGEVEASAMPDGTVTITLRKQRGALGDA